MTIDWDWIYGFCLGLDILDEQECAELEVVSGFVLYLGIIAFAFVKNYPNEEKAA